MYDFEEIRKEDPEIAEAIQAEMARQNYQNSEANSSIWELCNAQTDRIASANNGSSFNIYKK